MKYRPLPDGKRIAATRRSACGGHRQTGQGSEVPGTPSVAAPTAGTPCRASSVAPAVMRACARQLTPGSTVIRRARTSASQTICPPHPTGTESRSLQRKKEVAASAEPGSRAVVCWTQRQQCLQFQVHTIPDPPIALASLSTSS